MEKPAVYGAYGRVQVFSVHERYCITTDHVAIEETTKGKTLVTELGMEEATWEITSWSVA